jgi:hypothetical protein
MEGLQRAENPTEEYPKVSSETLMGEGVALRGLRPRWRLRRPRHIGSSCDVLELRAPIHARLLARSGAAAFGRSGHWQRGLRPRWRLRRPLALALACDFSTRAVQSRASARSQALDATCVSRKRHQVHGDASFCAERKIPTNIAGIADKLTVSFRRANAQEARRASTDTHINGGATAG